MKTFKKDPSARLDYHFDFAPVLNDTEWSLGDTDYLETGETLTDHTVLVDGGGVMLDSSDIIGGGTTVRVWLSGGTVGQTAVVTCRITTSAGRVDDRSFKLRIAER